MRLRRRSRAEETDVVDDGSGAGGETPAVADAGPYDVDDLPDDEHDRIDVGSLLIAPGTDRELRLQVDESSGQVASVVVAGTDGAVEMRAFAAPRGGDLWSEVRPQIAADMAERGGTATEREGRFGTELVCELRVQRPEGAVSQPSRILGINGPRWMLRATLLGRPATEPDQAAEWEDLLLRVAVRRGDHAMPVGEALELKVPDNARRVSPPDA